MKGLIFMQCVCARRKGFHVFSSDLSILHGPCMPQFLQPETLADVFEASANAYPDHTCLIDGSQRLTYRQVNEQADVMAHHLLATGAAPGDIIGLWLARGSRLLIAQLAITKAGAAWLPFDADAPAERVVVCLEDAAARGIISDQPLRMPVMVADFTHWQPAQLSNPPQRALLSRQGVLPSDPAYVIYTSGSTGKPKGIVIRHENICPFLRSENHVLGVAHFDLVYQGFSVAFDMSFEEIWISWLVGASLWLAPKALVADPVALPQALQGAGVTVLHAVPTLLALFADVPASLRIINMGGEMCPDALVARLNNGHVRLFNTYGPTEATVSATLEQLALDRTVTIGTPLPNYGLAVVNEQLGLLPINEVGELCIFGPGVAYGYLGRPDLTAEKFMPNPFSEQEGNERLYRTGDLARILPGGSIECLGRADDQVKIRGFRVELGEIEAALSEQTGVATAAVLVRQVGDLDHLVAWVVAEPGGDKRLLSAGALREILRTRLPDYMIPTYFEFVDQVPRLISGKIDRKALAQTPLKNLHDAPSEQSDQPRTTAQQALFGVLHSLFPGQPIRLQADFFSDMGGHSLLAARLVSRIRALPDYAGLTVQNVYQSRTVEGIASCMQQPDARHAGQSQTSFTVSPNNTWRRRLACGIAQFACVPFLITLSIMQWLAPFFTYHNLTGEMYDNTWHAIGMSFVVFVLVYLLSFLLAILGRQLLTAGMKPGRYPLWGWTFFRWWLSDRLSNVAPLYLIAGTRIYAAYLRCMGARIGSEVMLSSMTVRVPSLLTIESGASIGADVHIENARVENGELVLGATLIGRDAYVGSYCVLEGNTAIAQEGRLNGLSSLYDGQQIGRAEVWEGSPSRRIATAYRSGLPTRPSPGAVRIAFEWLFFCCGSLFIALLFFTPLFPTFIFIDLVDPNFDYGNFLLSGLKYFVIAVPASFVLILFTALLSALVRWLALPKMQPGRYSVYSSLYYRKWLINQIQAASLHTLHGVYATVFASSWYRLLGARIGKNAEISTIMGAAPNMLTLGDDAFIADAVMLGDDEVDGGWMTIRNTMIGHRSFIGNGAYVPDGTVVAPNVLIGVQTRAPDSAQMKPGDTWFGSPPIILPAREMQSQFDERSTFRPTPARRAGRALVESLRIVLPMAFTICSGYLIVYDVVRYETMVSLVQSLPSLIRDGLLYGVGSFVLVVLLKWLLLGRYRPRSAPMWSLYVWVSEAVTNVYESMAVSNFLNYLRGTVFLPFLMRLLGVRIGKGVYLDTTDITEFDCVQIGDHAELNGLSGPQTHLFEDRIMKIGQVQIGRGVNLRARSTVLYDASIGQGARIGPLSTVMKGESIAANTSWIGSPVQNWQSHRADAQMDPAPVTEAQPVVPVQAMI